MTFTPQTNNSLFKKLYAGRHTSRLNFKRANGSQASDVLSHEIVKVKTRSGASVTNYLLHASYEGLKQNLQGIDINIDYLLLTARVYTALGLKLAKQPVKLISQAMHKIILPLNRHQQSVLN